jgi:hypothetical protein
VGRACGTHVGGDKVVQGVSGKSRRKEPLRRPGRRWETGMSMDLRETGGGGEGAWMGFDWIRIGTGDEP